MIRSNLSAQMDHDPHFRWRGESVTRVENLADIVFALALGMLVSASDPPSGYPEMQAHLMTIIPVIAGFAILWGIWNAHFTFFRRYGVADKWIVFLNAALLLVILYIAYPLRFIFDSLFFAIIGLATGDWSPMAALGLTSLQEAGVLMGYFAAGYTVIFLIVLSMYSHAMRKADQLELTESERIITRRSIWRYRIDVVLGAATFIGAVYTPLGPWAGFFMNLNMPAAIFLRLRFKLPEVETDQASLSS